MMLGKVFFPGLALMPSVRSSLKNEAEVGLVLFAFSALKRKVIITIKAALLLY
nr:hypothetical protein Iba_chr04dCG3960 [Ipomoea batatas]